MTRRASLGPALGMPKLPKWQAQPVTDRVWFMPAAHSRQQMAHNGSRLSCASSKQANGKCPLGDGADG